MGRDIMASELRKARERVREQKQFINECMNQYNVQQKRACDAEAKIKDLVEMLKVAHGAIKSLPIDCMGEGRDGELVWPIRDEVLDGICATLARVKGES